MSYNLWFLSIQIARSLTGILAGDVTRLINQIKRHPDVETRKIYAVARGDKCPVLTHAAAFNPVITKVALLEPLGSFRLLVMHQYYKPNFIPSSVAGSIGQYDLPDLYAIIAPRTLLLVNIVDQIGQPISKKDLETDFTIVNSVYKNLHAAERFNIREMESFHTFDDILTNWLISE